MLDFGSFQPAHPPPEKRGSRGSRESRGRGGRGAGGAEEAEGAENMEQLGVFTVLKAKKKVISNPDD